jgi:hypothetical protein
MYGKMKEFLQSELQGIREAGLYKTNVSSSVPRTPKLESIAVRSTQFLC